MDDAPRVSEALYVGLCHHIGAPTYVTLRRELIGMEEMIQRPIKKYNEGGSAKVVVLGKASGLSHRTGITWFGQHMGN